MLVSEIERSLGKVLQKRGTTDLVKLLEGHRLSAGSEGKSGSTIAIVEASVRYLDEFLSANGHSTDVAEIGAKELRQFVLYLQEQPRFAHHRFTKPQGGEF